MRSIAPLGAPQTAGVIMVERVGAVVLLSTVKVSEEEQFRISVTVTA